MTRSHRRSMKRLLRLAALMPCLLAAKAYGIDVDTVRLSGPFVLQSPVVIDSTDTSQKKFGSFDYLATPVSPAKAKEGRVVSLVADSARLCAAAGDKRLVVLSFPFRLDGFAQTKVRVSGPRSYKVYIDGREHNGSEDLQRGQYEVTVKMLADTVPPHISVEAAGGKTVRLLPLKDGQSTGRPFDLSDVLCMKRYDGVRLSPSGKYAAYSVSSYDSEGKWQSDSKIVEVATKRILSAEGGMRWMPKSERLLKVRHSDGCNSLLSVNPADMSEVVLCDQLPQTDFVMSPTEDFLVFSKVVEGPQREGQVYEILTPDDRQPGWRNRSLLQKMDLATGVTQTLTYGNKPLYLCDIAPDGKSFVFAFSEERLTKRPTSLSTYCRLNLQTMECDTLISREGFINRVAYVPGTQKLVVVGSAEAFGRVGCVLPDSVTPNMYDYQMFLFDLATREVTPVTRDFDPSVADIAVPREGGCVFFTANKADSVCLYRLDAKTGRISLVSVPADNVLGISVSADGSMALCSANSACVPDRLYVVDAKKLRSTLFDDANADRMTSLNIGTCLSFSVESQHGYKLTGHYYLPAGFDPAKKYPVIVHYYGGCSPTTRRFGGGGHYPAHYWNAMGYVVLICNPGGASGFGQQWASRHVNTMGEGIAEDIIETVQAFRDANPWVDGSRIGCVSASYGGFMTQLLLTKTDMFAAGVSHAGISDHTSYWGEGYWGYSYSQVCAADSYPWTRKDLFVDRSPLYNADKIKTPLLFTHGSADTNVPIGESIQMYTALKLLGTPTAFVVVEGENHGIMNFSKRKKWINTITAWFDRYLKGDDSWWNSIYTPKDL